MIKVLFICLGNICRSPMAEFVLKDMVKKRGLENQFVIASAATSSEESGNPVYPPARAELAKHGIPCEGRYSVTLKKEDYDAYDYLICMDESNFRNIERITGKRGGKILKLLSFTGSEADISDPWYTGRFERTFFDVERGCEGFLRHLEEEGRIC